MKILLCLIFFSAILPAQPACSHVLRWAPQGAIQVYQQGILTLNYTQSAPNGRTVTPGGWNDQDQIVIFYIREIDNPGQIPPAHYSAPIQETQVCTGAQNPPNPPPPNPPPPPSTAQITRQQCVGSGVAAGTAFDCSGIEFWTVTAAGTTQVYAVVSATDSMLGLPPCPAPPNAAVCLQPAALGDAPLRLTADYNEPQMSINGYAVIPWNSGGRCDWMPHCLLTVP